MKLLVSLSGKVGIAFWVGAIFILSTVMPVMAHDVSPTQSNPAEGAILDAAPPEIRVVFDEELETDGSRLQVVDAQGKSVDLGGGGVDLYDPDHATMLVKLPDLPEGVYTVNWTVALTDGDSSSGSFNFGVGNVTLPAAQQQPAANPSEAAQPAGGGFSLWIIAGVAVMLVAGAVSFIVLQKRA